MKNNFLKFMRRILSAVLLSTLIFSGSVSVYATKSDDTISFAAKHVKLTSLQQGKDAFCGLLIVSATTTCVPKKDLEIINKVFRSTVEATKANKEGLCVANEFAKEFLCALRDKTRSKTEGQDIFTARIKWSAKVLETWMNIMIAQEKQTKKALVSKSKQPTLEESSSEESSSEESSDTYPTIVLKNGETSFYDMFYLIGNELYDYESDPEIMDPLLRIGKNSKGYTVITDCENEKAKCRCKDNVMEFSNTRKLKISGNRIYNSGATAAICKFEDNTENYQFDIIGWDNKKVHRTLKGARVLQKYGTNGNQVAFTADFPKELAIYLIFNAPYRLS